MLVDWIKMSKLRIHLRIYFTPTLYLLKSIQEHRHPQNRQPFHLPSTGIQISLGQGHNFVCLLEHHIVFFGQRFAIHCRFLDSVSLFVPWAKIHNTDFLQCRLSKRDKILQMGYQFIGKISILDYRDSFSFIHKNDYNGKTKQSFVWLSKKK